MDDILSSWLCYVYTCFNRRLFVKQSITRLFTLIAILSFSSLGFGQGSTARNVPSRPVESASKRATPKQPVTVDGIEADLKEALGVIESGYVGSKKLDYNEIFKSSIDSALHTLDPHSNYFDAKDYEQFNTDQSSRYYGIGATIGDLSDADGNVVATYIKATFDGAPANKAGLRYGDKIVSFTGQRVQADGKVVEVKNESLLGKPFPDVRSYLRGPEGTTIQLTVQHLAGGKLETVDITRGAVPQPSISEWYMIRPGVGYMAMRGGFNKTTYAEFVQAMKDLKAAGMQQLVIDLRDNGGGLVSQAYRVANSFLNDGQIVFTQKGRMQDVSERYPAQNRAPDRSPVVMIVNRNTASASEILAGAMQDHDRALIVGENTFGKGLVQNPFMLDYGSMLLLTIAKYETPSGRLIQRDYSNGDLYNYYTDGGSFRNDDTGTPAKPKGVESKTDTGRAVYSGGGINPDVPIKPQTITIERARVQQKLSNPVFAFAMELVQGKVKGLESYKVNLPIVYNYDIKESDFAMNDTVFSAFKQYAADKYKVAGVLADHEREFVERTLRSELVTAAYGSTTSFQVLNEYDDQLLKAIDQLPQAKALALKSERARTSSGKLEGN
jgi:carboxyl-terminal processing protease